MEVRPNLPKKLLKKKLPPGEMLGWLKEQACIEPVKECWNWLNYCDKDGYGQTSYNGTTYPVHRLIIELVNSCKLSKRELVMHTCNNEQCYNLKHLEIGSASENMKYSYISKPRKDRLIKESIKGITNLSVNRPLELANAIKSRCITVNGCWLYPLPRNEEYGCIGVQNKTYRTHRLMLALKLKKQYDEINITRHSCHNKNCCNPDHLKEGDNRLNALDSRAAHSGTLLSEEKVIEILQFAMSRGSKMTGDEIDELFSKKFNVANRTISSIRLGDTWKDIYEKYAVKDKLRKQLSRQSVIEILKASKLNTPLTEHEFDKVLAEKYTTCTSTIRNIRLGITWKNIYSEFISDAG